MSLIRSQGFWGEKILNQTDLVLTVIDNAVYVPFSSDRFLDVDPEWGVYDSEGTLVQEGSYRRGPSQSLVGQSLHRDLSNLEITESPYTDMIYGGPIIPHYGHFIITTLARIWASNARMPLLFHSMPSVNDHGLKFVIDAFAAGKYTKDRLKSFMQPVRIRRLFVPQPSLVEQFYVSPVFSKSIQSLGSGMTRSKSYVGKNLYLSKSRLSSGVTRLLEEEIIEDEFKRNDFEIVYPELMGLYEQVDMFRSANRIVGVASSAFHTVAFLEECVGKRTIFSLENGINSNFALLDYGCAGPTNYFSLSDHIAPVRSDRFLSSWKASNTKKLALDMVAVAYD